MVQNPKHWLVLILLVAACTPDSAPLVTRSDLIAYNQTVEAAISGPGEEHHWAFVGSADDPIDITLVGQGITPALILRGPGGVVIEEVSSDGYSGDVAFLQHVSLPSSGTYTLIVALPGAGEGRYTLSLSAGGADQAALAATTAPPERTRPPTAPPITATPTPSPTATPTVTPTAPPAPIDSGAQLEPRRFYQGRLDQPGEFDRYTIFGQADGVITVGMIGAPGSGVDPYLEIYSPAGDVIAQANNTFGTSDAVVVGLELPTTGAYVVFARDASAQGTGAYLIAFGDGLTLADRLQAHTQAEAIYSGVLDQPGLRDVWTLDLTLGDVISAAVVVDEASPLDPVLELIAPDGQVIRTDDNSGGGRSAALRQIIAPQTGRYALAVSQAAESPLGPYTLIWRFEAEAPTAVPSPTPIPSATPITLADQTLSLTAGAEATLTFAGRAGLRVTVAALAVSEGFDPVLALYAPDGSLIGQNDDSATDLNPRLTLILPADGTYTVLVRDYAGTAGTFRFLVTEE